MSNYLKDCRKALAKMADCSLSDIEYVRFDSFSNVFKVDGIDSEFVAVMDEDVASYLFTPLKDNGTYDDPEFWEIYANTEDQPQWFWKDRCRIALIEIAYDYLDDELIKAAIANGSALPEDFEDGGKYADPEDWEALSFREYWAECELDLVGEDMNDDYLAGYMRMCNYDWERLLRDYTWRQFTLGPVIDNFMFKADRDDWLRYLGCKDFECFVEYDCYIFEW